jgi:integrase
MSVTGLIGTPTGDPRGRLAVLLGALCGFRLGEVRGLLWGDIGEDVITVCHNYQDDDGLKAPKWNSSGVLPITATVRAAIDAVHKLTIDPDSEDISPEPEAFVMESLECPGKPYGKTFFVKAFQKELEAIGIPGKWRKEGEPPEGYVNEQQRRNLTFHSLRHTFVTLGRLAGISDLEIQALARHKSGAMGKRFSET